MHNLQAHILRAHPRRWVRFLNYVAANREVCILPRVCLTESSTGRTGPHSNKAQWHFLQVRDNQNRATLLQFLSEQIQCYGGAVFYMPAANTETLASTRRYTQLNARALLYGEVSIEHRPILTLKIYSIDLFYCNVSSAQVMLRGRKWGIITVNRIFVAISCA